MSSEAVGPGKEEQAMDRRQRKTRRSIYEAFESLMMEEHYGSVTVSQIIERADIGRSTFYAHFETKDELLNQMCAEMFAHIFEGVNEHCVTHANLQTESLTGVLAHLLYHLRDSHSGVCGKLVAEGEPHFRALFAQELSTLLARRAELPAGVDGQLCVSMLSAAFLQAVSWWYSCGADLTPEEVAASFLSTCRVVEKQTA